MANAITRTYTFANGGVADGGQVETEISNIVNTINNADAGTTSWTQVKTGVLTTTGVTTLKGSATNDSAGTGNVGEYISSTVNSAARANVGASTVWGNITSISLTAGDWDVTGEVVNDGNDSTGWTRQAGAVSAFSGNTTTDHVIGDNDTGNLFAATNGGPFCQAIIPAWRVSLSTTTVIYLKAKNTNGNGTPLSFGRISARRVR